VLRQCGAKAWTVQCDVYKEEDKNSHHGPEVQPSCNCTGASRLRKLAVLLHRLWVSGEVYEPLRNSQKVMSAVA
jgi:hypothetical protein